MFSSKGKLFWKNKKVFVTGHTGFKGAWLCLILNQLGAKITGYSLQPDGSNVIYKESKIEKNIKNYYKDIRDYKKLNLALQNSKPDIVFHLAAQPIVLDSYELPKHTFEVNFNGTLNILEGIKKNKIKSSVIVTTDKVYKNLNKNIAFKEVDELGGDDPYSASKSATEILVNSYNCSFFKKKIKVATVRAGNIIGGGDRANRRILPDYFRSVKNKKKLKIRFPNAVRPWQFVLEPLIGYLMIAEANYRNKIPKKVQQNWNFSPIHYKNFSVSQIIEEINKYFHIPVIHDLKKSQLEKKFLKLSSSKAKKYIGWKPYYDIKKTIKKIVDWELNYQAKKDIKIFSKLQITSYLELLKWK